MIQDTCCRPDGVKYCRLHVRVSHIMLTTEDLTMVGRWDSESLRDARPYLNPSHITG